MRSRGTCSTSAQPAITRASSRPMTRLDQYCRVETEHASHWGREANCPPSLFHSFLFLAGSHAINECVCVGGGGQKKTEISPTRIGLLTNGRQTLCDHSLT